MSMIKSRILVVEDDRDLSEAIADTLEVSGYSVSRASNGLEALSIIDGLDVDLVISDVKMPNMDGGALLNSIKSKNKKMPVIMMTAYGTIGQAVESMRNGAADYISKPFDTNSLISAVKRHLVSDNARRNIVAVDRKMLDALESARRVAPSDLSVLLQGKSGAGKEVVARYIHDNSARSDKPYVAINCAAIPESMLEAVLFGYEKGAFTGATQSLPGKFEQANGGTILLDEISEMNVSLQAKLLRVIQEREVERLGGRKTIKLDVRIIATTNVNLKEAIKKGLFREDLYYRLNVFPIHIPSLNERRLDIPALADFMLSKHWNGDKPIPMISEEAYIKLSNHDWTGNVRELENVVQRAIILSDGDVIQLADIQFDDDHSEGDVSEENLSECLRNIELKRVYDVLMDCDWNRDAAADRLGVTSRTVRNKIVKLREIGIKIPDA